MEHKKFTKLLGHAVVTATLSWSVIAQSALAQPQIEETRKIGIGGVYELAVSASTDTVYVAATGQRGSDATPGVVALDADTLAVKKEFDVSSAPFFGLALNDETQILYGTSTREGKVAALDLESGELVGVIDRGDNAHVRQVRVDEDSNTVYVSVVGTRNPDAEDPIPSELWVIDGDDFTLTREIRLEGIISALDIDYDAGVAYMADLNDNRVFKIDIESGEITDTWTSGGEGAINVAVDADGERLFVANQGSGTVTVLDTDSGEVLKSIDAGEGSLSVIYSAAHDQVYATNRRAGTTSVIDGSSYEIIASLETGSLPQSVVVHPQTGAVYVSNKARGLPRNAPADAEPVVDDFGDTVNRIRP